MWLPADVKNAAGLLTFSTTSGWHSFPEHTWPDLNQSPASLFLAGQCSAVHMPWLLSPTQTNRETSQASTAGHTLKKRHACLVNWSAETATHSSFPPFIALYSHKQGTSMSCRQPYGNSLKFATRTIIGKHDCFWCRQSTLISYSDQMLRSSRKYSEPDLYHLHFSLLLLQILASYWKIGSMLSCTWWYCVLHQFSWTWINLPTQRKRRRITTVQVGKSCYY